MRNVYSWVVNNWIEKLLLPAVFTAMRFLLFFVISIILYVAFYRWMVPRALAKEPVYFDYSQSPPIARVNLMSLEKQWSYVDGRGSSGVSKNARGHFLRGDFAYMIDASFRLSKSRKNYELGKFMVFLDVVDSTGASLARSARPVAVPYQSASTLLLDSVCTFPLRVIGLTSAHETSRVDVSLMNAYWERAESGAATEVLELTLDSAVPDIVETTVTVMPVMRGVTAYMWHYPVLSAVLGVASFTTLQVSVYSWYLLCSWLLAYSRGKGGESDRDGRTDAPTHSSAPESLNDDDDSEDDSSSDTSRTGQQQRNRRGPDRSEATVDSEGIASSAGRGGGDDNSAAPASEVASDRGDASVSAAEAASSPSEHSSDLFAESQAVYNRSAASAGASRDPPATSEEYTVGDGVSLIEGPETTSSLRRRLVPRLTGAQTP
jgi:hypothetical protein